MATETGPNIVNTGLVMNFDASSIRSFQGVARTNLARGVGFSAANTNTSTYKYTQGTEVVDIPQVGKRTVKYVDHWNDYGGGSGQCCPNLFYYHDGWISVSGSTTYTYSLIYKTTTGYTHPNFMYRYEYVNSSTYVTEGGVHNDSNRIHLGDGWYYAWGQFTTQPSTNTMVLYLFYYQYATWDRVYVDRASLVAGSTVPDVKHITAYNSTNSGNWTDTIGGYTGTLTNGPTYDSSNGGSIVFDGSNDYIQASSFNITTNAFTIEAWVKINSTSGNGTILKKNTSNDFWPIFEMTRIGTNLHGYYSSENYGACLEGAEGNSNPLVAGNIYHLVYSKGTGGYTTMKLYVNGSSVTYNNYLYGSHINTLASSSKPIHIGINFDTPNYVSPLNANVYAVRVYNTQLTDAEVLQNFNATRARFGV